MEYRNRLYDIIAFMFILIIILILMFRCKVVHPQEQFIYDNEEIYHISIYNDTTELNWSDLSVLQIDSLERQYLEYKAER